MSIEYLIYENSCIYVSQCQPSFSSLAQTQKKSAGYQNNEVKYSRICIFAVICVHIREKKNYKVDILNFRLYVEQSSRVSNQICFNEFL